LNIEINIKGRKEIKTIGRYLSPITEKEKVKTMDSRNPIISRI